ncbi:hypothetical protein Sjap_002558 [Stephania japonica]|uniref:Uncharacterized protein n=1 Tax=Stephania japonica TaxID=461633 RepID=A0AAP0PSN0_9MAGN
MKCLVSGPATLSECRNVQVKEHQGRKYNLTQSHALPTLSTSDFLQIRLVPKTSLFPKLSQQVEQKEDKSRLRRGNIKSIPQDEAESGHAKTS